MQGGASQPPRLGLELKARYAAMLLAGDKTIELRRYRVPDSYLGVPVLLLATPDGNEGVSMLPDLLPPGHPGVRVAGSIVFASQKRYASFEEFAADEGRHRVPATGTPYGWTPGVTTELWGWEVQPGSAVAADAAAPAGRPSPPTPMRRVLSSWFEACNSDGGGGVRGA